MIKIATLSDYKRYSGKRDNHGWIKFYPKFGFRIEFSPASYFDPRWCIHLQLLWGSIYLYLPIESGIEECDPPSYGLYWYEKGLWFMWGKKIEVLHMPWSFTWVRHSYLRKDGKWEHETPGHYQDFHDRQKWDHLLYRENFPYTYTLKDGTIQNIVASIQVEEWEWCWRWFTGLGLPHKLRRSIYVNFDHEVGEKAGRDWKGGVLGCGYEMLLGETPEMTLRRMEKERKF